MAFGRKDMSEIPGGYRKAAVGEEADMELNGVKYVRANKSYSDDDGSFKLGDVGDRHYHDLYDRATNNSIKELSKAEKSASSESANRELRGEDSKSTQQKLEETSATSGFINSVNGRSSGASKSAKSKMSVVKGGLPALFITALIALIGGGSMMGVSSLGVSLVSNLQDKFDSISVSQNRRTKSFLKYQTNKSSRSFSSDGSVNDFVKKRAKAFAVFGGSTDDYFKVTKRQESKLKKHGITIETESGGNQVMKFTDSKGAQMTIVADAGQADPSSGRFFIDDAYSASPDFRESYFEGAKTWRGSVGAWFDSKSKKFMEFIGLSRNNLSDFKQSSDQDETKKKFQSEIEDTVGDDSIRGKMNIDESEEEDYDSNGDGDNDGRRPTVNGNEEDGASTNHSTGDVDASDQDSIKTSVETSVGKKVDAISERTSEGVDIVCTASDILGGIANIALVYQMSQTLKVASVFFEGIQKSQVEDSQLAAMNEIGNLLTTTKKSKYTLADLNNTSIHSLSDSSGDASIGTKDVEVNKSAMESAGVQGLYGGYIPDSSNSGLQSFNIAKWALSIAKSLGLSPNAFKACSYAKIGAAAVSAGLTAYEIASCFLPPVVGCFGGLATQAVQSAGKVVWNIAKQVIKQVVISAMVPFFGNMLARGLATKAFGEELGNTLVSGASIYMGKGHQYNGGAVADKKAYLAYLGQQEAVLAEKALYESSKLSPFDMSSKNTFMGRIYQNAIPLITQNGSLLGGVSSIMRSVGTSVGSLIPGASAVENALTVEQIAKYTAENCSDIDSIGGLADEYCNPYIITDTSTIDEDPGQVIYDVYSIDSDNFEDTDGDTPKIKEKSELAKYILYCGERESPFGIIDPNIASSVQGVTTGNSLADGLVGMVPIVGDVIDGINSSEAILNMSYISGEACVTNNETSDNVQDWDESKVYQRFIEDQRLAESSGIIEESSVTAFLNEYYEKNPKDNSYEGILARYTGMTKENVILALKAINGMEFLAEYNPNGYGPLFYQKQEDEIIVSISEKAIIASMPLIKIEAPYLNVRKRAFMTA